MKPLSETANGGLKDHISLETYVQMTYFDRTLRRANAHLMQMSGGKYDLKRREGAAKNGGQNGLDLDVIDHYNGSERSVKSLSGGETFLASLLGSHSGFRRRSSRAPAACRWTRSS